MHHQRACRKEPARGSPLGRYAGRPPLTPGLKLEIRPYRADARSVSSSTPPANQGDVARVGGLDRRHVAGRNRSTFPGAWDEANVRYPPLIGHSATASTPLLTSPLSGVQPVPALSPPGTGTCSRSVLEARSSSRPLRSRWHAGIPAGAA